MRNSIFNRKAEIEGAFSNGDMEVVVAAMHEAYSHTRAEFDTDPVLRGEVESFITHFLLSYQVASITMTSSLDTLVREIFGNKTVRDFVLTLQFNFFARWGEAAVNFTSLTDSLSYGVSMSGEEQAQFCLVPKQLREAVPSQSEVRDLLNSNKWLVTLLVMKTAVSVTRQQSKQPN